MIEGRPPYTKEMEKFNMDLYKKQRKDRLADSICDYISDEDVTAKEIYDDILDEVKGMIDYHKRFMDKSIELKELLISHNTDEIDNLKKFDLGEK
ncbi:hypothetical protein SWPG_00103 [Synechococcus phage S-CBM2]|nr:hypothetical protein SWPG_00103 [Synechococcus phage S-CBM2]